MLVQKEKRTFYRSPPFSDFPQSEFDRRLAKVRQLLQDDDLAALVLWDEENGAVEVMGDSGKAYFFLDVNNGTDRDTQKTTIHAQAKKDKNSLRGERWNENYLLQ